MDDLAEVMGALLEGGRLVLEKRPSMSAAESGRAEAVLRRAFAAYRLAIAGPPMVFSPNAALAAARFTHRAAWFLVSSEEPEAAMVGALAFERTPQSAEEHVSADLVFRYLPAILRRARGLGHADKLAVLVGELLRKWPLSGVLADISEAPESLDFAGHPGLQLLYAERLAAHFKPCWVPKGSGRAYFDLVWAEQGKDPRLLESPDLAGGVEV